MIAATSRNIPASPYKTKTPARWPGRIQLSLFAAQRWPAFKRFIVVSFPIGKIWSDPKERVKIESKVGSILEENAD
jgi:hypothetical protein